MTIPPGSWLLKTDSDELQPVNVIFLIISSRRAIVVRAFIGTNPRFSHPVRNDGIHLCTRSNENELYFIWIARQMEGGSSVDREKFENCIVMKLSGLDLTARTPTEARGGCNPSWSTERKAWRLPCDDSGDKRMT